MPVFILNFFRVLVVLVLALNMLGASTSRADTLENTDAPEAALVDRMQSRYESLRGFGADFTQTLTNGATKVSEVRQGQLVFQAPGLVRWEVAGPQDVDPELLVVGENFVWDYFPAEGLAIKYTRDQVLSSTTMLNLLAGKTNLARDFFVEQLGEEGGLILLGLTPKVPEATLVAAKAWVNPKTAFIHRVELTDFYGNTNAVKMNNIQLNPNVKLEDFEFTPPTGIAVQDNTDN